MLHHFKEDLISHLMFVRIEKKKIDTNEIIKNEIDLDENCPCNSGKSRRNCCSREIKEKIEQDYTINFFMNVS